MRAVQICGAASSKGVEALRLGKVPKPVLSQLDNVLIKVAATAVNRGDIMQRKGLYPPPRDASEILGLECSGIVVNCLPGTRYLNGQQVNVGDRVMALLSGGSYADFVCCPVQQVVQVRPEMSLQDATAIPEVFATALQCLRFYQPVNHHDYLTPKFLQGKTVLVHAGASGVGLALCQIAKTVFGASTVVATCSPGKMEQCAKFATHVLKKPEVGDDPLTFSPDNLKQILGAKSHNIVDVVIDPVFGGDYFQNTVEVLAPDCAYVVLAFMGGTKFPSSGKTASLLFQRRASVHFTTLRNRSVEYKGKLMNQFSEIVYPTFFSKTSNVVPNIGRVLSIDDVQEAHRIVENNEIAGKCVMIVDSTLK